MWTLIVLLLLASNAYGKKFGSFGGRRSYGHQSHTYPHSNGHSGTGSNTFNHYQNNGVSNTHNHYQNNGGSNVNYPPSNGMSGNNHVPKQTVNNHHTVNHKTEVHHHHHYSPPQQIGYQSVSYPVYHGSPPVYVYQYRDSGSRFDTLLTGLALYNLGRMSAHNHHYDSSREYRGNPGETCKLGIQKSNGDYEETRIDCRLMSSFMDTPMEPHESNQQSERKTITSTVVQTNSTNGNSTVTVTKTTVVDAMEVKGESIRVTQGMKCFVIRSGYNYMKKTIDCGLLQTYAQHSFNSAQRFTPILTWLIFQVFVFQVI